MYPARSKSVTGNATVGCLRLILMLDESTTSTLATGDNSERALDATAGSRWWSRFHFAAAASSAVPSWNFTPLRSVMAKVFGSVNSHFSASDRSGSTWPSSPIAMSGS